MYYYRLYVSYIELIIKNVYIKEKKFIVYIILREREKKN